jgi:hypothetical protein
MSRNDYRPLNVRDALSYLDKVKVSLRFSSSSLGPPTGERDVQLLAAVATWIENRGSRFDTMGLFCLF